MTSTSQTKTIPMGPSVLKVMPDALTSSAMPPAAMTGITLSESDGDDGPVVGGNHDCDTDREEEASGDDWLHAVELAAKSVPLDDGDQDGNLDGSNGEGTPIAIDSAENPEKGKGKTVDMTL